MNVALFQRSLKLLLAWSELRPIEEEKPSTQSVLHKKESYKKNTLTGKNYEGKLTSQIPELLSASAMY